MAVFLLILFGLSIALIALGSSQSRKIAALNEVAQASHLAKVASLSSIEGFKPEVIFEGRISSYSLAIDPTSEQFAIAIPNSTPRLYHFSQLVAVEIVKDDETIVTTKGKVDIKGAALATALIGPIGMSLGAKTSSTSTSTTTIKSIYLKLYVNDLHTPCFNVSFYRDIGPASSRPSLGAASRDVDAWFGRFQTILVNLERQGTLIDASKAIMNPPPLPPPSSPQKQTGWAARTFGV